MSEPKLTFEQLAELWRKSVVNNLRAIEALCCAIDPKFRELLRAKRRDK